MSQLYVDNIKNRTGGAIGAPSGVVVTGVVTATDGNFTGNVSVGGTLTYQDVTNIDSVGIITANSGIKVTSGGIDATGVVTATSFSGDGSGLTFAPKIIAFDPAALATEVVLDKTITITFDQDISFSGNGTVELRSGSSSGTVIESFAITSGTPATGLSISGTQLIINPTSNFDNNTVVYVILPSTGIVNGAGGAYGGSNNYNFRTVASSFSASGGTVFTVADGSSPTGYYKYHVFAQSGILTTTNGAQNAADFDMIVVGGGGGGGMVRGPFSPGPDGAGGGGGAGGYIAVTQSTVVMAAGTYTIGIGTSGVGGNNSPSTPDALTYGTPGGDTTITPPAEPTTYIYRAIGGGGGGGGAGGSSSNPGAGLPGGSGGGGMAPRGPQASMSKTNGGLQTPGQGYAGGEGCSAKNVLSTSPEEGRSAGGGGGAGGAAEEATALLRFWGPTGPNPTDLDKNKGGAGGAGAPNPAFASPNLSLSGIPAVVLNAIGPTGLYAGGGGGASCAGGTKGGGQGGAGGGGHGDNEGGVPNPYLGPNTISPGPYPSIPVGGFTDATGFGGGGGGSVSPPEPRLAGAGYPGCVMIRYETPAP